MKKPPAPITPERSAPARTARRRREPDRAAPGRAEALPPSPERISFWDAQKRERAASTRWLAVLVAVHGLLLLVSAVLLGAPIGCVIALVVALAGGPNAYDLLDLAFLENRGMPLSDAAGYAYLFAIGALPGLLGLGALFVRLERLATRTHDAVNAKVLKLRAPDARDLEETQFRNTVEEMAVAACCPAPQVAIIDAKALNLAVLTCAGRTTVVATRGLLAKLSRDETQAMSALAIATICNGDGRFADRWLRLGEAAGLVTALSHWLVSKQARAALRPFFAPDEASEAESLAALRRVLAEPMKLRIDPERSRRDFRQWLYLPLLGVHIVGIAVIPLTWLVVMDTLLGVVFQRRRRLADAGAVQFQRLPDALASVYARLESLDTKMSVVDAAPWLANVFVLDPTRERTLFSPFPTPLERLARVQAQGARVVAMPAPRKRGGHPADRLAAEPLASRIAFGVFFAIVSALFVGFAIAFAAISWMTTQLFLHLPLMLAAWALVGAG